MTDNSPSTDQRYSIAQEDMATIVIFGVTGDLAGRKLIPAVYNLWNHGYLPRRIAMVGVSRRDWTDDGFREQMCEALKQHSRTGHGDSDSCDPFVSNLYYHRLDFSGQDTFEGLAARLDAIEGGQPCNRLFYLAVAPEYFAPITARLGEAGLICPPEGQPWSRVVVEKPFGVDLESARILNQQMLAVLGENQIFRIDHYLGKETVQNLFAFRFGNAIFEPLFNNKYVDHVQITVAESVGMEGRRGAFYDEVGALRDVVQNHVLQLLSLVAMEPPARFNAKETRDEKVKVLRSIELPVDQDPATWCVRGQYADGPGIKGYLTEEGVAPDSVTETYAALRLYVDNWRWAGVPFCIRTGKALRGRVTEIAIQFKCPPTHHFRDRGSSLPEPNLLTFRIQPDESIALTFNSKPPGMSLDLDNVTMDFSYHQAFQSDLPEAYERLLLDALRGDSTLFMRADEIEAAWEICTRVLEVWKTAPAPALYRPGTWGPQEAHRLFVQCGKWREPEV